MNIAPYEGERSLLTFYKSNAFLLAIYDGRQLDWKASRTPEEETSLFYTFADRHVFIVEPEWGRISLAGADFLPQKVLLKERTLKPSNYGNLKLQGHGIPGLAFKKYLTCVTASEKGLGVTVMQFQDADGKPLKPPEFHRESYNAMGRVKADPESMVVATNGKQSLVFMVHEKFFTLPL